LLRLLPVVLLAGILFTGCGDDDGGGGPDLIEISDFEGEWVITQYKATWKDVPSVSLELISLGGAMTFEADETGDFMGRTFIPASLAGTETAVELTAQGEMELLSQDSLLVTFNPELPPFLTEMRGEFEMIGNTVTLYDENAEFDFDGDQQLDPSIFEGTMVLNDGSYPPVIFVEDFEGYWEITSYTVTSVANPQVSMDAVAMGASFSFDADEDGDFLSDAFIPAALAGTDITITDSPGFFELVFQDTVRVNFTPEIPPFLTTFSGAFTMDGDEVTVIDENAFFDFGQGAGVEAVIFEGIMVRTTQ
jgi:hypothetical protein